MIRFELIGEKTYCNGKAFPDLQCACKFILLAGHPDDAFEAYRGDMLCLYGSSIQAVAYPVVQKKVA